MKKRQCERWTEEECENHATHKVRNYNKDEFDVCSECYLELKDKKDKTERLVEIYNYQYGEKS